MIDTLPQVEIKSLETRKIRLVLSGIFYPFAILSYFRHALEKRPDVELFTLGAYTGDSIPWGGGMRIPMKYVKPVDLPLPPTMTRPSWHAVKHNLPWTPDLVIACDAGFHFSDQPDCPYAVIATDPHVLGNWYEDVRPKAGWFFGMQRYYLKPGDIFLPYCCSPDHHYAMSNVEKDYDASLIGLHYEQRDRLVNALRSRGRKVLYDLGLIYDEYRQENNRATIGLNWSSLMDINARTMEIMAMRQVPVINRLPHLEELGLVEGKQYLGFDTVEEAVDKVEFALANPEWAKAVATSAHNIVHERHTYELRIQQIFDEVGLA